MTLMMKKKIVESIVYDFKKARGAILRLMKAVTQYCAEEGEA